MPIWIAMPLRKSTLMTSACVVASRSQISSISMPSGGISRSSTATARLASASARRCAARAALPPRRRATWSEPLESPNTWRGREFAPLTLFFQACAPRPPVGEFAPKRPAPAGAPRPPPRPRKPPRPPPPSSPALNPRPPPRPLPLKAVSPPPRPPPPPALLLPDPYRNSAPVSESRGTHRVPCPAMDSDEFPAMRRRAESALPALRAPDAPGWSHSAPRVPRQTRQPPRPPRTTHPVDELPNHLQTSQMFRMFQRGCTLTRGPGSFAKLMPRRLGWSRRSYRPRPRRFRTF
mmetsp:Transcript_7123/g.17728  ORF Transcript_7123/g.17728 Transcript_7123/m.17728 type:complete len:292 (+) Transcript_7123:1807-2682(+)